MPSMGNGVWWRRRLNIGETRMKTQRFAAAACFAVVVSGCTTLIEHQQVPLQTRPAGPGLNYFLPKQVYTITATFELKSCPDAAGSGKTQPLLISQAVSISEASVADRGSYYSIPLNTLTSAWKTTSLSATMYENQTLHTVGATADDRTAGVVKGIVGTALSIARVIVGIGAAGAAAPKPLCSNDVYTALKTIADGNSKLLDPRLDEKARTSWVAAMAAAQSKLKFQQIYEFDPSSTHLSESWNAPQEKLSAWFVNPARIATASKTEQADYAATLMTTAKVAGAPLTDLDLPEEWQGKGVLYREPAPVTIQVCAGACEGEKPKRLLASFSSWAGQLGRKMVITLENGPFEKNNIALSFAANGRMESLNYGTESQMERLATSLSENASSVEGFLTKKRIAEEEDAKLDAGAELAALQHETGILKAKADLIDARKRLIELGEVP